MDIDLRQLRYFLAVAEELSFTRAAARLHMSQPPLSQAIAQLEAGLKTRLFTRTSRRVELTAAGQEMEAQARALIAQAERAQQQVMSVGAGRSGKIEIGATGTILRGGLAGWLADYRRHAPEVRTVIYEQAPALQVKDVLEHRTDISFNRTDLSFDRSVARHPELGCTLAWRESVSVILPRGHRLAAQDVVALADLAADEHVMLHPESSEFARYLQKSCVEAGFLPRVSQQVVDSQSIPSLIAAGFGVALVPASTARFTSNDVAFRMVTPPLAADVYMIFRRHEQSPAVHEFLRWRAECARIRPAQERPETSK
ncbi:LysR substrate-binding domain-containing protein [Xanthobacter agilis]|uniref:LysR substrate-binding domain-containing protein n=1 Tax=Xanthobacter agilis TaxID=47492 RepID=UPI00372964CA